MADDKILFSNYKGWENITKKVNMVDSPAHYTNGGVDVIEVIEDAVKCAEEPEYAVHQSQVIKYIMRMWLKGNPLQDAKKARWYLNRLIDKLESNNE